MEREHLASSPSSVLDSMMYVLAWTRETLSQRTPCNERSVGMTWGLIGEGEVRVEVCFGVGEVEGANVGC